MIFFPASGPPVQPGTKTLLQCVHQANFRPFFKVDLKTTEMFRRSDSISRSLRLRERVEINQLIDDNPNFCGIPLRFLCGDREVEFGLRQKSIIWRLESGVRHEFFQSTYRSRIRIPLWREAPKLENKSSNQGHFLMLSEWFSLI
jgi:hypothetical protein